MNNIDTRGSAPIPRPAAAVGIAIVGIIASLAAVVSAQTAATPTAYPAPMVLEVDERGEILIRGVAGRTESGMLTVDSWGGRWTIRTAVGTEMIPAGTVSGDASAIAQGNFVGVQGSVATDQPMTIDAIVVRDWTAAPVLPDEAAPEPATTSSPAIDSAATTTSTSSFPFY